tara:strand:- start:1784 stop:2023 length:240 start_codon:yes stop_codon:yes gene_type:complete
MKKIIILQLLSILLLNNAIGAIANCNGGKCEFSFSNHYKSAQTNCYQTLNYEEVETNYLYFIILKNNERCDVFETIDSE